MEGPRAVSEALVTGAPVRLLAVCPEAPGLDTLAAFDTTAIATLHVSEAVMKALGVGLGAFAFHDVEVVNAPSGKPSLVLRGKAAALAQDRGVRGWELSLTHTDRTAHAVAVAL